MKILDELEKPLLYCHLISLHKFINSNQTSSNQFKVNNKLAPLISPKIKSIAPKF